MTIEEIRSSGILELYVLGQLTAEEERSVRGYLREFPDLQNDLEEIELALEEFAQAAAVTPPAGVKERILEEVSGSAIPPKPPGWKWWRLLALGISVFALVLLYLMSRKDQMYLETEARLQTVLDSCQSQGQQQFARIQLLEQLTEDGVEIVHMTGTEKYPQTDLYFYHNPQTRRNFIQVQDLPAITGNQSYQLWSLKPEIAPIPLDVFQGTDSLIEVRYEDASQSYAITIEPFGGQQSPTLEDLIGIVNVGS